MKPANSKNHTPPKMADTIFDEQKKAKQDAKKVLEKAKEIEKEKLQSGLFTFKPIGIRSFVLQRK